MFKEPYKAQSSIEYITTYGWVVLILAIILATLYALGLFTPSTFVSSVCILPSGFGCLGAYLTSAGNFIVNLQQSTTSPINVTALGCNSNASATNMKVYAPPIYIPIGSNFTGTVPCYGDNSIVFSGSIGTIYRGYIVMNYTDLQTGFPHTIVGSLVEKVAKK